MSPYSLARAGDAEALSSLVREHMPMVYHLCKRFPDREDAFQLGCMGLVKAIRKYDEASGFRFSTYAYPLILGEMRRSNAARLGWRARASLRKARAFENERIRQTGKAPTIREMAASAGVSPEEMALLLETAKGPAYDETGTLFSSLKDPSGESWLLRLCVQDALDRMDSLDKSILIKRYYLGYTQAQLAKALGVHQSQISRREKLARQRFYRAWTDGQ